MLGTRTSLRHTRISSRVLRLGTATLLGCFAVLGTATPAAAAQSQYGGGELSYYGEPGEDNDVMAWKDDHGTAAEDDDEIVIVESGHMHGSSTAVVIGTPPDPTCTVTTTNHPDDTLRCPASAVTTLRISGGDGPDTVTVNNVGSLTSATVYGDEGADQLSNYSETPTTFFGGPGADSLQGRSGGSDTVDYSNVVGGVTVNLRARKASADGEGSSDIVRDITNVVGSNFDDTIEGDDWDNVLRGLRGTDTVSYSGASEGFSGETGVTVDLSVTAPQDTNDGVDTLSDFENVAGSLTGDTLSGDENPNVLSGGGGDDTLNGRRGDDTFLGGTGSDTASFADAFGVDADLGTGTATGQGLDELTGVENLLGSPYADRLTGNALNNQLRGGAGNDILNGRGAQDYMDGGADFDTADYSSAPNGVTVDLPSRSATGDGDDTLWFTENVTGSPYDDWIIGDDSSNVLDGRGGNDDITGGDGNDTVIGALGNDTLMVRDSVADTVRCGPGTDSVTADSIDTLSADCEGPPPAPKPTIRIADAGILEGNTGTRALSFRVTLSSSSADPVTVHWATFNGSATAPSDFAAASGTVTFAPGQTTQTITVTIKGDRVREPNQTFTVRLDNPQQATIADGRATGTIRNDD
jgi:Ca2+-binding RTX toxin-like protein